MPIIGTQCWDGHQGNRPWKEMEGLNVCKVTAHDQSGINFRDLMHSVVMIVNFTI